MKAEENSTPAPGTPGDVAPHEQLLQAIWDHSLDAILLTAPDGRIFAANPAACSLFGRTEAEICRVGRNGLLDATDPQLAEALAERARTGETRRELTFLRADGSRFTGELTSAVFTDRDGQIRTSMIIRDISARKEAEAVRQESAAQYRSLFENSIMGISQALPDGRLLRVNQAYAEMYGYATPAEMLAAVPNVGQGLYANPDERQTVRQILSEHGSLAPREFTLLRRDGSRFVALVSAREIRDANGQLLFYQAEHADITARKQAENALRESEEEYRNLFENMFSGFILMEVLFDAAGQPVDHRLLQANAEFDRMTGLKRNEEIGRTSATLGFKWPAEVSQEFYRVALGGPPLHGERFNESLQRYYDRRVFSPRKGQFAVLFSDITARKVAEEDLQRSEQKFRAIFALAPVGVLLLDAQRRILDANPAVEKITGLGKAELLAGAHHRWRYLRADGTPMPPEEWASARALRENRVVEGVETGIITETGRKIWLQASAVPLDTAATTALLLIQDITARQQAEVALRQSERRFATIFRASPSAIGISRRSDGIFLDVNDAFVQLYGYPRAEIIGHSSAELRLWHSSNRAEVMREVVAKQSCQVIELQGRRKDGEIRDMLAAIETIELAGEPCIVGILTDITARKQAEAALHENEQRLRVGLELANIAVFNQDLELRYTWMYQPQLGYTAAGVLGKTDGDLLPHAAAEQTLAIKRAALASGQVAQGEVRVEAPSGTKIFVFIVEPLRNAAGTITGITGASLDITEHKQTAAALRQSEERLHLVMEATRDGIWDWDLQTDRAYLSPRYYELTGYQPGEFASNLAFFKRIVHPDDFPLVLEKMTAHLHGLTEQSLFDYRLVTKTGAIRWVFGRGRVVERDATGAPLRMVGTITDITDRKQVEADLAASQTALRALAARLQSAREEERQRIARRVHDDLGHAFTDLKLDLAWLDRRLAERKLTRRAAARQKIAAMIQRVEADLNTTRTLSADLRPAVLDSLGLVAALEWAAQQFERRLHIPCTLELPADFPPLATDRAAALFRAFEEILSNVARHAGATSVRVRLTAAAGQVTLEVDDNGRGITMQERDAPAAIGLLGLRERALEFGGTVEIEGAPAKGTRVRVSIPAGTS